jgi:hypothetical protein
LVSSVCGAELGQDVADMDGRREGALVGVPEPELGEDVTIIGRQASSGSPAEHGEGNPPVHDTTQASVLSGP